jgi:DNA-binding response OmpR family regulator
MEEMGTISIGKLTKISSQAEAKKGCRVLVVDDDNDVRQFSVNALIDFGYEVEAVEDGAAGWEALRANDYDLIITDNQMPRMSGIEMLEKVRAARMSIPIIMATSHLPTDKFISSPWLKPNATLSRPFSINELLEAVKKVLGAENGNSGS